MEQGRAGGQQMRYHHEISYTMSEKISAFTIDRTVHETNADDILIINSMEGSGNER